MSTAKPIYVNPNAIGAPGGATHIVIAGVERVGAYADGILDDATANAEVIGEGALTGVEFRGLARASCQKLVNYWLELAKSELVDNVARAKAPIGSIWLALSDLPRATSVGSVPALTVDKKITQALQATGAQLPTLAQVGAQNVVCASTDATSVGLIKLFDALKAQRDHAGDTMALHWVGHGARRGDRDDSPDCLLLADSPILYGAAYVEVEALLKALAVGFAAEQWYAFIDACRTPVATPFLVLPPPVSTYGNFFDPTSLNVFALENRGVVLLSAAQQGRQSVGMPHRATFFTSALVDAFDFFGAKDPMGGDVNVGEVSALHSAVANHMFLELMGVERIDLMVKSTRLLKALSTLTGAVVPHTLLADSSGRAFRPLVAVEQPRSLIFVAHDKPGCVRGAESPVEAFMRVPPAAERQLRRASPHRVGAEHDRWRSACPRGADADLALRINGTPGKTHQMKALAGFQPTLLTF